METYEAKFLNHAGAVFGREEFEAESDDLAIEFAKRRFLNGIGRGFEIWREGKRLYHWPKA